MHIGILPNFYCDFLEVSYEKNARFPNKISWRHRIFNARKLTEVQIHDRKLEIYVG